MTMHIVKKIIKNFLYIVLIGFIVLWGFFWIISGTPKGLFQFGFVYYTAQHYFYKPVDKTTLFQGSLQGMVASLHEAHTMYLTPKEYSMLKEISSSAYTGIGIVMGIKEHRPVVISPIEDSPAAKVGIKSGDILMKINGQDTLDFTLKKVASLVRGKPGTTVNLQIKRGDELKDITVKREKIVLPTVKGKMLKDGVGYIRITQFSENTGVDFGITYEELKKKGMKKLILDLRDNPGGLVQAAEQVSSYILPKGPIVSFTTKNGYKEVYSSLGKEEKIPLVVLVNKGSASASEIISAAVQDEKAGTIIGTQSYGKGTVQTVIAGPGDDAVKVTIAQYHTPANRVIDGKGITPDIIINEPKPVNDKIEDLQLKKAIDIIEKMK